MNTDHHPDQPSSGQSTADHAPIEQYEIRVRGHLGTRWAAWFDGMDLTAEDDGTTVICGPVVDQAALHGLLQQLRDLGITLLSLTRIAPGPAVEQPVVPHHQTHHNQPGAPS